MTKADLPSIDEVALGAFFEDIGKFMQRAHGSLDAMSEKVRSRESDILPLAGNGLYSHKHALWTDAFFEWMEEEGLAFPKSVNLDRVRDQAVYHHKPKDALTLLSAKADRLSAGMDRKAQDEKQELSEGRNRWDRFRRTPLQSLLSRIDLGLGTAPGPTAYRVRELKADDMYPAEIEEDALPAAYKTLWDDFCEAFRILCGLGPNRMELFHEGLLALSERFTWSIPSSTMDQPDVSLHDHNRTVAAFAACLYRYHEAHGELDDEAAIDDDRERRKFRILVGDLSGIQNTLFRLASEGVKGVNRILRARSFLMGAIADAAALDCLRKFGLPPYCVLQRAGGRFQLLVPNLPDADAKIGSLREAFDEWIRKAYYGDLVLNIALTEPLPGEAFRRDRFAETQQLIAVAADDAKQRPLSTFVTSAVMEVEYPADGTCRACGVRPATVADAEDGDIKRCPTCNYEASLGRRLPNLRTVFVGAGGADRVGRSIRLWRDLSFGIESKARTTPVSDAEQDGLLSCWRPRGTDAAFPVADRFVANHVPVLGEGDGGNGRYEDLSEEARTVEPGSTKTFEHLAADAREWIDDRWVGRPMLAVLKADVDRLGLVFSHGLGADCTIGRTAALSRMLDGFFTGALTALLGGKNVYTVYSGGDDLLLIAPWYEGIRLAQTLRRAFRRFVGDNPNLTLSAGIELVGVHEPLNRAVRRAEARLEMAKDSGRDRVCLLVDKAIPWTNRQGGLDWALEEADWISGLVRDGTLSTTFLYRMLEFDRMRRRAEDPEGADPAAAIWRARWGYHLARLQHRMGDKSTAAMVIERLDRLIGGGVCSDPRAVAGMAEAPDPRIPITIALYRNR